jgi:hypothetical protein
MVLVTRLVMMVMTGVICFVLLLPLAMERHNILLAVGLAVIFALYVAANVLLWLRLKPRA